MRASVLFVGPEGWGSTAYEGDAGIDLPIVGEDKVLAPGQFADIPSGVKVAIPDGYYGRIAARSGALRNRKIRVYEGVIDAGYRGELYSYVENVGPTATVIRAGERLAQLIIQPVPEVRFVRMEHLPPSQRGAAGFGSSDKRPIPEEFPDAGGDFQQGIDYHVRKRPHLYIGGPLDFHDPEPRDRLIDRIIDKYPGIEFFDPRRANLGQTDPATIWATNDRAIRASNLGVFLIPDPDKGYGFGSPVEIVSMMAQGTPVVIFHGSDRVGVYLRKLWADGLIIATEWTDFIRVLGEEIAKVADG